MPSKWWKPRRARRKRCPPGDLNNSTGPDAVELSPAQITAKVERDPVEWNARIEALRNVALEALDVAGRKDVRELWDVGENSDKACEACHRSYWYPGEGAEFYRTLQRRLEEFREAVIARQHRRDAAEAVRGLHMRPGSILAVLAIGTVAAIPGASRGAPRAGTRTPTPARGSFIFALNAKTGKPVPTFGKEGQASVILDVLSQRYGDVKSAISTGYWFTTAPQYLNGVLQPFVVQPAGGAALAPRRL